MANREKLGGLDRVEPIFPFAVSRKGLIKGNSTSNHSCDTDGNTGWVVETK